MTQLIVRQGDKEWRKRRERAKSDLFWFAEEVLKYGTKIPMHRHSHLLLCKVASATTGNPTLDEKPFAKILTPREWGKTSAITIAMTIQWLCQDPETSILLCNEREQNAKDFLAEIKHHFEANDYFRMLFPELIPDSWQDTQWSGTRITIKRESGRKEPSVFVIGVGGTATGMHPDRVVVDDMISREAAENARRGSWQIMEEINRWTHQLEPLLSSRPMHGRRITFIGTNWFVNDCYDHIEDFFGSEAEPQEWVLSTQVEGGKQSLPVTTKGGLVIFRRSVREDNQWSWPEKYPEEKMLRLQREDPILYSCFPPETLVTTEWGDRPIAEITEGTKVRTHRGAWESVVAARVSPHDGELVGVRPWGSPLMYWSTPTHGYWSSPAVRYRGLLVGPSSKPVTGSGHTKTLALPSTATWQKADALAIGDVLWTPIPRAEEWPEEWPMELRHPEVWRLIGHWIGDGSISRNPLGPKSFCISHVFDYRDRTTAERYASIVRGYLGRKARLFRKGQCWTFCYGHTELAPLLWNARLGRPGQKILPVWVESLPVQCQTEFLEGYLDADGCLNALGRDLGVSVCLPLLSQIQRIAARLGFTSTIARTGKNHKQRVSKIPRLGMASQQLFSITIDRRPSERRQGKVWIDGDWFCRRIRLLSRKLYRGAVYNLTVEADHSYTLSANTVVRNCNYLNAPAAEGTAVFKPEWIKDKTFTWVDPWTVRYVGMNGVQTHLHLNQLDTVMIVDPGGFGKRTSEDRARAAIGVLGHTPSGEILFLDCWSEKETYVAAQKQIVAKARQYHVRKIGIENAGQQVTFIDQTRALLNTANVFCAIEELKTENREKDDRILQLEPYFQRGVFYIGSGAVFTEFRQQYAQFPRTARRDILDMLAYLPKMLKPRAATLQGQTPQTRRDAEIARYYARRGMPTTRRF